MPYCPLERSAKGKSLAARACGCPTGSRNAAPLVTKMPSISDIALGGYAVVATGLTVLVMAFLDACNLVAVPPVGEHGGIVEGRVLCDERAP